MPTPVDLRAPIETDEEDPYVFNPFTLRIPLKQIKARYDAETYAAFEDWARSTKLDSGATVYQWLAGALPGAQKSLATGPKTSDTTKHEQSGKTSTGKTQTGALERAAAFLGAGLRTNAGVARGAEEQWSRLIPWARGKRLILPADYPPPPVSETAEHDVRFDPAQQRWFKYTVPGHSGFTVDWKGAGAPALRLAAPAEYLQRLRWQNDLFADDIRLAGLWQDTAGGGWRIVTSQPDIIGRPATRVEILDGMRELGFRPLGVPGPNGAPAFTDGTFIIWDGHPGNFVFTAHGVLVPIDLIITRA